MADLAEFNAQWLAGHKVIQDMAAAVGVDPLAFARANQAALQPAVPAPPARDPRVDQLARRVADLASAPPASQHQTRREVEALRREVSALRDRVAYLDGARG